MRVSYAYRVVGALCMSYAILCSVAIVLYFFDATSGWFPNIFHENTPIAPLTVFVRIMFLLSPPALMATGLLLQSKDLIRPRLSAAIVGLTGGVLLGKAWGFLFLCADLAREPMLLPIIATVILPAWIIGVITSIAGVLLAVRLQHQPS
jgi:hypothetical protein